MADALCGPSTALQNFQKHSSVDRTLQQDRLVGRHSPAQGFRSAPGPNAGALDHEFEAFQAGHALPPQPQFQHLARPPPMQFAQAPQAPDWASDFQRLNISHAPQVPQQRVPAPNAASSWHQDFMSQQSPAAPAPAFQQNNLGGMSGYGMSGFARPGFQQTGFGMANGNAMSDVAQGKQRAQDAVPQFDEAAFEQAFADIQQEEEHAHAESLRQQEIPREETAVNDEVQEPEDPALTRIREQRPAVYTTLKIRSALDLNTASEAGPYLQVLETMEQTHQLTQDAGEARWVVDALQKIANQDTSQEVKTRSEQLIRAINERLMSQYPLGSLMSSHQDRIWEELEAAGYTRSPAPEHIVEQLQPEQKPEEKQQEQPAHDDDEMAQTAGRLLERVSDNTSEKFQNSQFLSLMRRLRDHEVRVEGDKMVEVSTAQSTSSPSSTTPQQAQLSPQPTVSAPQQIQLSPQLAHAGLAASIEHFNEIHGVSSGMDWGWHMADDAPIPTQPSISLPTTQTQIPPIDPKILDHAATDFETPVYEGGEQGQEYAALERLSGSENGADEVSDQFRSYNVHSAYHR